jgi:hypothetical protein
LFQDPQLFINKWLQSQTRDLKTMTDVAGNPEEERRVDFYYQPWVTEGVCRYRTLFSYRQFKVAILCSDVLSVNCFFYAVDLVLPIEKMG